MKASSSFAALLIAISAVATTSCANKPPFVELQEAVDKAKTAEIENISAISYDEITNTLEVTYTVPADMITYTSDSTPGPEVEDQAFATVQYLPDGIAHKAASSESNLLITYKWEGHSYQQMIEAADFESRLDGASKEI